MTILKRSTHLKIVVDTPIKHAKIRNMNKEKKPGFTPPTEPADPKPLKWWDKPCNHLEHSPPGYIYLKQGEIHTHTCPGCGGVTYMKINNTNYDPRRL